MTTLNRYKHSLHRRQRCVHVVTGTLAVAEWIWRMARFERRGLGSLSQKEPPVGLRVQWTPRSDVIV